MNPQQPQEPLKPLSTMEKIGVGIKSFVKSAISYIPSGLLYAGLMVGGSLAITALTGGIGTGGYELLPGLIENGGITMAGVAQKVVGTMVLGSVITGGIGAYKGVTGASEQRNAELEWQQRGVQVSPRARGLQRQHDGGMQTPQHGLVRGPQHQHGHNAPGI